MSGELTPEERADLVLRVGRELLLSVVVESERDQISHLPINMRRRAERVVNRVIAPLLAEAERRGAEKALRDVAAECRDQMPRCSGAVVAAGWERAGFLIDYRADAIAAEPRP